VSIRVSCAYLCEILEYMSIYYAYMCVYIVFTYIFIHKWRVD